MCNVPAFIYIRFCCLSFLLLRTNLPTYYNYRQIVWKWIAHSLSLISNIYLPIYNIDLIMYSKTLHDLFGYQYLLLGLVFPE